MKTKDELKVDYELRKYGISGPEQRGIRALGEALEKVLGDKREAYAVRLKLQTELQDLGYRITKIPKPRSN